MTKLIGAPLLLLVLFEQLCLGGDLARPAASLSHGQTKVSVVIFVVVLFLTDRPMCLCFCESVNGACNMGIGSLCSKLEQVGSDN